MPQPDSSKIRSHYDLLQDNRALIGKHCELLTQLSVLVGEIAEVTSRQKVGYPNVLHLIVTNPSLIDGMDTHELSRTTRQSPEKVEEEVAVLKALGLVSLNSDGTVYHDTLQAEATASELAWRSKQLRVQE
jgi:hypothetical protein